MRQFLFVPVRRGLAAVALALGASAAMAHGDVVPQAVDTSTLPQLGPKWQESNPYNASSPARKEALRIGSSAYNQNCARCHGLEAVSGGIAPDLRKLDNDCANVKAPARLAACVKDVDDYFLTSVRRGKVRNGAVYMPPFEGMVSQEAMWAIKAYLETRREKPLP